MQRRITGFDCIWLLAGLKKNICPFVVRGWELLMISQSSYVDVGVYTRMVLSKDVWKPLSGRRPSVAMAVRQLFRNRSIFNHQGSYIAFWGLLTLAHVIQCIIQFSNVTYEFQTCFRGQVTVVGGPSMMCVKSQVYATARMRPTLYTLTEITRGCLNIIIE